MSAHPFSPFHPQELGPSSRLAIWPRLMDEIIFQIDCTCLDYGDIQRAIGVLNPYERYLLWVNLQEHLQLKCEILYKAWLLQTDAA